jgi:hypothetical protein
MEILLQIGHDSFHHSRSFTAYNVTVFDIICKLVKQRNKEGRLFENFISLGLVFNRPVIESSNQLSWQFHCLGSKSFGHTLTQYNYLLSSSWINHLLFMPPLTGHRNEVQVRRIIRSAINKRYVYSLKHCAGGPNIARGLFVRVFSLSIVIVIF